MSTPYPVAPGRDNGPRGPIAQPWPPGPLAHPNPFAYPGMSPAPSQPAISSEQLADLREAWGSILKRKWYILALVLMASLVAFFVRQSMPPVYRAEVSMVLEGNTVRAPGLKDEYSSRLPGDYVQTQIEVIRSRAVAERTARALKLWDHPAIDPRIERPSWTQRVMQSLGVNADPEQSMRQMSEDELLDLASGVVMAGVHVAPVRNTYIMNLSFTHDNADVAKLVANELAIQYIANVRSDRATVTSDSSKQLLDRIVPLRDQLAKSEKALLDFTAKRGIVNMGGTGVSPVGQQMGGMTDKLLEARSDRLALESAAQEIRTASPVNYAAVPAVMRDPSMGDLLRQLSAAKAMRTNLLETFTPESFRVRQVDDEITRLQASVNAQAQIVAQSVMSRYEALRQNEAALERALGGIRGNLQNSNRDEFELAALQRAVEHDRKIFETFMAQVKEMGIVGEMQPVVARVLDSARAASAIPSGNPKLVQMVAIVTLFLACLGAAFVDRLDNTVKGFSDAEQRLGQHVLAALPVRERAQRSQMIRAFIDEPETSYAEGIRTARTGLMLSALDLDKKVFLVTSSVPGEGKTTVSVNLAVALSQTQSTLLIDCDLRRSRVGSALKLDKKVKGLTNLVSGDAKLEDCIVDYEDTGLKVLPVGKAPPNPQELLVSKRFQDTLRELTQKFDAVVIDSPPVELVSDSLALAHMVTNIVYVVQAGKTPAPLVRKGIARLKHAGGNVTGVVLNRLDFKAAQYYQGEYGYGGSDTMLGGYGYGNGYLKEEKRKTRGKGTDEPSAMDRGRLMKGKLESWVKSKTSKV